MTSLIPSSLYIPLDGAGVDNASIAAEQGGGTHGCAGTRYGTPVYQVIMMYFIFFSATLSASWVLLIIEWSIFNPYFFSLI